MTKSRFLAVVTALALLLAIPTAVFAQRVPAHVLIGSVTLDGATAADGAAVTAWIDGEQVNSTTVASGEYILVLDQEDSSWAGKTVSFKVSGASVAQTATWAQGGADVLDLVGDSTAAGGSGAQGAEGATGAQGAKGATGPAGPAGPAGADGSAGPAGPSGAAGPAGADGAAGIAGAAGADGADGSGGALGVVALIIAIVALVAAGGSLMMGRRA